MNHPREVRRAIRERRHAGHTAGLAPGYVQGNVCILPREYAEEFRLFCERNPKPCPLLAMSAPGIFLPLAPNWLAAASSLTPTMLRNPG